MSKTSLRRERCLVASLITQPCSGLTVDDRRMRVLLVAAQA